MIDAHQHFWKIGEYDCTWPTPELSAIYRNFLPADLEPLAKQLGVSGSVLVQSQESDLDTDFLLQLAANSSFVKAVVGWVDFTSVSVVERIGMLAAQHNKLRGLRPMLQSMPEDSWILKAELEPALDEMQRSRLSLDALVFPRHLLYLRIFAKRHPRLPIVIDHGAKPGIAKGGFEYWAEAIGALAELPHVYCKLSGLLTEAAKEQGLDQVRPYVVHLYRLFGAERLMWGSDWPVLNLAPNSEYSNYGDWLAMAKLLLPVASNTELDAIFGYTARNFYRF